MSGDDNVLATVNSSPVTQVDLDLAMEKTLGSSPSAVLTLEVERKVLESLVMMRAIAQKQELSLDEDELERIDAKTRRYREELMVEAYLRANAKPYIPAETEIRRYYDEHPKLFGVETVYSYEVLTPASKPADEALEQVLKLLESAKGVQDWHKYADGKQPPLSVVQGQTGIVAVDKKLLGVIEKLKAGETSDVLYIAGKPQLVRVIDVGATRPQPLAEVRSKIRNSLVAQHLKVQIKEVADEILAGSKVVYTADTQGQQGE